MDRCRRYPPNSVCTGVNMLFPLPAAAVQNQATVGVGEVRYQKFLTLMVAGDRVVGRLVTCPAAGGGDGISCNRPNLNRGRYLSSTAYSGLAPAKPAATTSSKTRRSAAPCIQRKYRCICARSMCRAMNLDVNER